MSKFCPIANAVTNCTDNCHFCLQEEEEDAVNKAMNNGEKQNANELLEDLHLEQLEQM